MCYKVEQTGLVNVCNEAFIWNTTWQYHQETRNQYWAKYGCDYWCYI